MSTVCLITQCFNMAWWNVRNQQVFNVHGSVHRNNILIYIQQDAMLHSSFYLETALHISGGTTTHHQERKQLYLQHLVFVTPLLLSAAIVEELELVWVRCGWRTAISSKPAHQTVIYTEWHIPNVVLIQLILLMMGTWLDETRFFCVALRPHAGHGLLILEVSRSHTTTHYNR